MPRPAPVTTTIRPSQMPVMSVISSRRLLRTPADTLPYGATECPARDCRGRGPAHATVGAPPPGTVDWAMTIESPRYAPSDDEARPAYRQPATDLLAGLNP